MSGVRSVEVIDAHQHIWNLDRCDYPWMDPADPVLHRDRGLVEAMGHLDAAGIAGSVLVQSADDERDSLVMFEAARADARVRGVVAWVPLDDPPEAERLLDRWAGEPAFCGIRSLIHERDDAGWLSSPATATVLRMLAEGGIPMDVVAVKPAHLRAALEVGERLPELRLVIDHLGHPPVRAPGLHAWAELMTEVAANPQTHAKVSGLYATAGSMENGSAADVEPVLDAAHDIFGTERLMYGGDWPICELAGGYPRVWSALSAAIGRWDEAERAQVLGETATQFYGLRETVRAQPENDAAGGPTERTTA